MKTLPHSSLASYAIGFALSLALTLFAFWQAPSYGVDAPLVLAAAALLQLFVQLTFFLHLGRGGESATRPLLLAFTAVIVGILVVGTLWIMANLERLHLAPPTSADLYEGGIPAPESELR